MKLKYQNLPNLNDSLKVIYFNSNKDSHDDFWNIEDV